MTAEELIWMIDLPFLNLWVTPEASDLCFFLIVEQSVFLGQELDLDYSLKVPKREIFDRSNFPDFNAIKSSCVGDLVVKILTYYFNF